MSWLVALKTLGRFAGAMIASMEVGMKREGCLHEVRNREVRWPVGGWLSENFANWLAWSCRASSNLRLPRQKSVGKISRPTKALICG